MRRAIVLFMLVTSACATPGPVADRAPPGAAAIDAQARRLMQREDVKGMALAVIEDGAVAHVAAYGFRNVEKDLLLEPETVMYGASFTKTAFAYMVLQLVDEGLLDLDAPLGDYLQKPLPDYDRYADLAGDARWRRITARHVLTHSPGFHNFRWLEDDKKLRIHFDPGARYAYSGEGFYLLQFALEEGLGLDVEEEMQTRVFNRFGMARTSMQWREDFAGNLADGYAIDGAFEPHDARSNVSAAGSMDTTIADQARMWAGIVRGDGLSPEIRAEFARPQLPISTASQFPPLWKTYDPRGEAIDLSAGLGLVTYQGAAGLTWFKGGHNDWTGNFAICEDGPRRCVVLMANSVRAELIYPELVRFILADPAAPFWWEYPQVEKTD